VRREPGDLLDLRRALATLPEKERLVIEAVYAEGQSYEEAAARLGMPLGTLKRLQTQGLRILRQSMGVVSRRARSDSPETGTHS
jgi:RNA polymerase sigma-70 factor (ECF subfamily)